MAGTHFSKNHPSYGRLALTALIASFATALTGCGGGAETETLPITAAPDVVAYSGPPPATDDVQSFKVNVWDNLKAANRCGACHSTGGQSPSFVRQDDVNMAYAQANAITDLAQPETSRLVTKVAGGHNCWLESDAACGDILATWIGVWAGTAMGGSGREIELSAPDIRDVGSSRNFPLSSALFESTVYPLLDTYCSRCHESSAQTPQSPYFADQDVDTAYDAAIAKINLDQPDESRLVLRLANEFHNCWGNCQANAGEMLARIDDMANSITPTEVDPAWVTSKALTMYDGVVASGGNRFESNTIALYEFKTGEGRIAYDTSGIEPALNLNFDGDVEWVGGWGINLKGGKAQGSTVASAKLHNLITATGEYSIEAWVVPGNVTQEEARIVSYSAGTAARNFSLTQTLYNYDHLNRSGATDGNGEPALSTDDNDEDLQATLQHVVANYDPVNGRRIYVNGEFTDDSEMEAGTLDDWDDSFAFVLGNEASSDRPWQGALRLVAIHNRVLTDEQIQQNFQAGVGEKFFLLFSVTEHTAVPDSYIVFEVSQFDSYSYLFNAPMFVSLDPTARPGSVPVQGIRIGRNGTELTVGQAYSNVDMTISNGEYTAAGQPISALGTIIGLEKGPQFDEFFLSFDLLGASANVRLEPAPLQAAPPADRQPASDIGLRTFDEINASMAALTTVSANNPNVRDTYALIRQQLPTVENFGGFLASHQVAVAQLAIEYCNELVNDTVRSAQYFPGVDFSVPAASAFDSPQERDAVLNPLLDRMLGIGLQSQPARPVVRAELDALIDRFTVCAGGCDADRTATITKAVCSAVLGSAAILVQ